MMDKKQRCKFTIQFNPADPMHEQVIDLLNRHGRKKSQFIVNAITHYINSSKMPSMQSSQFIDVDLIEKIVRNIINEQQTVAFSKNDEETVPYKSSEMIAEDSLESIANTMAMFRGA